MKKELSAAVAILKRLAADPTLEQGDRRRLQRAHRELAVLKQSGKLTPRRVFRAVKLISETLWEINQTAKHREKTDDREHGS